MPKRRKLSLMVSLLVLGASAIAITTANGGQSQRAASTAGTASAAGAQAATRYYNFRGTITSRSRGHWFQMHTTSNRSLRIYTNGRTHWDDCDWGQMGNGHHVYVSAYRSRGAWYASRMQNWNDWDHGRQDHGNNHGGENGWGGENGNGGGDWDD